MNRFDLRNDLAVQAAKALDAKIKEAIRAAFDSGRDFVRDADMEHGRSPELPWQAGVGRYTHVVSYRAGPIEPDQATPARMVRYTRPIGWRQGQRLV